MFDFDKGFVFLDKELEQLFPAGDDRTGTKFVDKLVKVFTKQGVEKWILAHIEVQGYKDADFPKRMYTYFCRIYDRYNMPVTSIAIFTDSQKSYLPQQFDYSFLGTQAIFRYNAYKIIDQDEAELSKSNNPFAMVILTVLLALKKGKITEEELLGLKTELVKKLIQKQIPRNKISAIFRFIQCYVSFDNPEMSVKFDTEINLLTNKQATMGIEQFLAQRFRNEGEVIGIEKGLEIKAQEDNYRFVKSLLTQTDFTAQKIASVADVTVAFVEEVRASLGQSPQ